MSGLCVDGLVIAISGDGIAKNANEGMMNRIFLNSAEHAVAASLGLRDDEVAAVKAHGRGGLNGVPLLTLHSDKRPTSPFAPAQDRRASNLECDADEDDDEDDDGLPDFKKNLKTAIGITFPDGSSNRSRRRQVK